jgi:hypothetical protein
MYHKYLTRTIVTGVVAITSITSLLVGWNLYKDKQQIKRKTKYNENVTKIIEIIKKDVNNLKVLINNNYDIPECCFVMAIRLGFDIKLIPDKYITHDICCTAIEVKADNYKNIPTKYFTTTVCKFALCCGMPFSEIPIENKTDDVYKYAIEFKYISFVDIPDKYRTEKIYLSAISEGEITFDAIPEEKKNHAIYKHALLWDLISDTNTVPERYFTCDIIYGMIEINKLSAIPQKYLKANIYYYAINHNYSSIKHIPEKYRTDEICKLAILNNVEELSWIENPNDELCLYAIQQSDKAILYIRLNRLTMAMCEIHMHKYSNINNIPDQFITKELLTTFLHNHYQRGDKSPFIESLLTEEDIDDIIDINDKKHVIDLEIFENNVLSGIQFNKLSRKRTFVKLTTESENHNDLQFVDGLVKDILPFSPYKPCSAGGIYFCDKQDIRNWLTYSGNLMHYIRSVTIPDDAKVYIEKGKYKTDQIILGPRDLITDHIAYSP